MKIDLKEVGNFELKPHPQIKNVKILQIFFENGYGVSVVTLQKRGEKINVDNSLYDIAIIKGNESSNNVVIVPEMEYVDPDYDNYNSNNGVWINLDFSKIYHKAKIISLL